MEIKYQIKKTTSNLHNKIRHAAPGGVEYTNDSAVKGVLASLTQKFNGQSLLKSVCTNIKKRSCSYNKCGFANVQHTASWLALGNTRWRL